MSALYTAAPALALTPVRLAAARLQQSRERMRLALLNSAAAPSVATNPDLAASAAVWRARLTAIPGAGFVVDAVFAWWAQHPLRVALTAAAAAAQAALQPVARRHPLGLVLGALVLGGLLVWARPWRGVLRPALFAGLLPQLLSKALADLPARSWLAALSSWASNPGAWASAARPAADAIQASGAPPASADQASAH